MLNTEPVVRAADLSVAEAARNNIPDMAIPVSKDGWKKRLAGLDEGTQKQIAQKYYGGHMPWKE